MKKKLICVLLLVLTFTVVVLSGCEKDEEYVDKGLSVGFESTSAGGDISFSDYCAYKSDVSEFDINDVTLHFFIGGMFSDSIEHELECGRNFPSVKLYFKRFDLNESAMLGDEPYFITEISDYVSEKYRWKGDQYELEDGLEITIPSELFIGESGRIAFIVKGIHIKDPDNEYKHISSIWIFYTVDGNKVTLSENEKSSQV
jgi:hypothetical protein